ncbi:MAG: hypothetical protein JSV80_09245, partial [Acidobacteriota bacterium]
MKHPALSGGIITLVVLLAASVPLVAGEAEASEDGITIVEGEEFSLTMHVLGQVQLERRRRRFEFGGGLYGWLGERAELTPVTDTTTESTSSFHLRRARAIFEGNAFRPWVNFRLELESNSDDITPELLDGYVEMAFSKRFGLTVGQFKTPFDLFELTRSWRQAFGERALGTRSLVPGRDIGLMGAYHGSEGRWHVHAAYQNGSGANSPDTDDDDMYALRVELQSEGGFDYDLSAISRPDDPEYAFGVAYLGNSIGLRDMLTGGLCMEGPLTPCEVSPENRDALEVFGALRVSGFQISASLQSWTIDDGRWINVGAFPGLGFRLPLTDPQILELTVNEDEIVLAREDLDVQLVQAEASAMIGPRLEAVGRFSKVEEDDERLVADPATAGLGSEVLTTDARLPGQPNPLLLEDRPNYVTAKDRVSEWGFGVNYYISES